MRFERLVIEADDSTFALDFHPKLTVISSVGQVEREGLINELVGSLSSSRPGVHAEVVADNGGHFAIFRPRGARPLVVDVDASADVSARFTDAEGEIDLLSVAGMTARDAKRTLRVTRRDLDASTHHEKVVRRLAKLDPDALWAIADETLASEHRLEQAATSSGSSPEDATVVSRIEERHERFEEAQRTAEESRRVSFIAGVITALALVPTAMFLGQELTILLAIIAVMMLTASLVRKYLMLRARKAEEAVLAEAGAQTYLGFHMQRVNGLVESQQARQNLIEAKVAHDGALERWAELAGDISLDWAFEHRDEIEAAATHVAAVTDSGVSAPPDDADDLAACTRALMQRVDDVRTFGPASESLPLIIDDAFSGLKADLKAKILGILVQVSESQQVVLLTSEDDVADWARSEAIHGTMSIIEPSTVQTSIR
jgi:uncharacterized protein YhaN